MCWKLGAEQVLTIIPSDLAEEAFGLFISIKLEMING